jgi:hypothetical protein
MRRGHGAGRRTVGEGSRAQEKEVVSRGRREMVVVVRRDLVFDLSLLFISDESKWGPNGRQRLDKNFS